MTKACKSLIYAKCKSLKNTQFLAVPGHMLMDLKL